MESKGASRVNSKRQRQQFSAEFKREAVRLLAVAAFQGRE